MTAPSFSVRRAGSRRSPARWACRLLLASGLVGLVAPARALEALEIELPVFGTGFRIELGELESPEQLIAGTSDLAELDRATDGRVGRQLLTLFNAPLPADLTSVVEGSSGQPLFEQALMGLSQLVDVEGVEVDTSGRVLAEAIQTAKAAGQPTLLGMLRALPGSTATINLGRTAVVARRLRRNQREGRRLVASLPAATVAPSLKEPGPNTWERSRAEVTAAHRPEPISVEVVRPLQGSNRRVVVISHGLWDSPASFGGWAEHLASHGFTVLLPEHQGSDKKQQSAMRSGTLPPPTPEELRLRPIDVSRVLDALSSGALIGDSGALTTDAVGVIGHSWGGTTVIQLAGAEARDPRLVELCDDYNHPSRNLSWFLQCSLLSSADGTSLADPRVKTVIAVSPVVGLLFDPTPDRGAQLAPMLLTSGTADWVVPSGPEALTPFRRADAAANGHRLVLADGGDHFNLRAPDGSGGGALGGLILAWMEAQLAPAAVDGSVPATLPPQGWGDVRYPLVDVTSETRP
ncbi:dienelactone hydrolase [Synechococcus sp. RSCCF101]|uniref:dienelactone hydrolase n=1 Tax=Synechococcus sp. RSCCF101 TaxID=2511069 RepID=UPI001248ED81|nr:dienelactone hydrolase [Synechococcus sp. RSCCF101]QEY32588.1 dienelactone hydrolase [Synechococcus sp. RSCCF101]